LFEEELIFQAVLDAPRAAQIKYASQ
jgi:hypothetical protein